MCAVHCYMIHNVTLYVNYVVKIALNSHSKENFKNSNKRDTSIKDSLQNDEFHGARLAWLCLPIKVLEEEETPCERLPSDFFPRSRTFVLVNDMIITIKK